ncbi:MAG: RecX family transcriptional regulator [Longicatena sp.]
MRIGLFTDTYTPDINGVVSSIVTLQKELEEHGHDVFVITNHKAISMKKEGNILRLPGLELKWLYGYRLSTPYHFSARDEIKKMNLDIIHVHTEFGVGMFGRIVARNLNIPVVSTYHTMYEDYTHYFNRFDIEEVEKVSRKVVSSFSRAIGDNAQAVISPSDKTKETLVKYGVKTPIYVIPTGLNFDKFNRDEIDFEEVKRIRHSYNIEDDDQVVTFVGRIAQEKSIDIPIEGFRYVKNPKIKLFIVGGGPQLDDLKAMVKNYHLEKQVIFTDKKTRDEIPLYYACADCFVSASLTETQGMTYIEALACGLPVFARPDEVLEDLVFEGDSGFLFETPQEFGEKLTNFMALSQKERDDFHDRAIAKVSKYDSKVFCSKILSVYYQAINDFEDAYEVTKIKTFDGYVRIYVENEKEDQPIKILIDLDDYFSYKIRLHTMLDRHKVAAFRKKEIYLESYLGAIKKLRIRDYTRKEMQLYFHRIPGLEEVEVNKLLDELEEKGYINDALYMQQKIEKMHFSLAGKGSIRRTLISKGLEKEDVEHALESIDDEYEKIKASKMAEKLMATIKGKSLKMKKQTIIKKLISLGFDSDIALKTGEHLDFENEDDKEALHKTILKAQRSYARKYEGQQLENRILTYCMQKGFLHEDIINELKNKEWGNEL